MKLLKRLFQEEEGVTVIEYALIAALIAIAAILVITGVGQGVKNTFQDVLDELKG